MGIQTSAKLFYGVPLPDGTDHEDGWEERMYDLPGPSRGITAEWVGTSSGMVDYLTAVRNDADLGDPATVILGTLDDAMYEGMNRRLRRVWQSLGLPVDEMPEPGWVLAASAS